MSASASSDPLAELSAAGVSVWLDDLSRELLAGGELKELIADKPITLGQPYFIEEAVDLPVLPHKESHHVLRGRRVTDLLLVVLHKILLEVGCATGVGGTFRSPTGSVCGLAHARCEGSGCDPSVSKR